MIDLIVVGRDFLLILLDVSTNTCVAQLVRKSVHVWKFNTTTISAVLFKSTYH